jgi:metal-responsive CopG/Arc/MetJ family transcriptional regulator
MRITASIPEPLLEEARAVANDIGVSLSRLLKAVVEDFLQRWRPGMLPEAIDHYIAKQGSGLREEGDVWPKEDRAQDTRVARRDGRKRKRSRKAVVSFPADLLDRADAAAMVLGVSRSKFVCIALCDFLVRHNSNEETRQLNKYYIKHPSEPDPFLDYLALETMKRTEWEE